ncbi:MAG TPA: flavoprotein [Gemmataceae bacterium]|jgi:phosphopantothenoylcysteine decarboxylase|nr:flavoprotein [Gemmataceae bacterium]
MHRVLLGITGSVAAIRAPALLRQLLDGGHDVKAVATRASRYFFDPADLGRDPAKPADFTHDRLFLDEDEWPGARYERDQAVLHIELRRWADVLVIAPLDANTLAKMALGLADNCLTCVWRAWDWARPVILAPAMNTLMWEHPLTCRHLLQLGGDLAGVTPPPAASAEDAIAWIHSASPRLRIVGPQSKMLACGDVGMGGLAEVAEIAAAVRDMVGKGS